MVRKYPLFLILFVLSAIAVHAQDAGEPPVFEEFCLKGEFDLGWRLQGTKPEAGEFYPTEWCVISSKDSPNVRFSGKGRSNPDMESTFTVVYLPPNMVRIVNEGPQPDLEFREAIVGAEAIAVRRLDPKRIAEEIEANPGWVISKSGNGMIEVRFPGSRFVSTVSIVDSSAISFYTDVDLPLRGRVRAVWEWKTEGEEYGARVTMTVDGMVVYRAKSTRRVLSAESASKAFEPAADEPEAVSIPGKAWPARVAMNLKTIEKGVHIVRNVRTGFHHFVVETNEGLVVADAPAGWVELHQLPPSDLVPGLGISGLSERFIDFLGGHFPGKRIRSVILTHAHDDHSGGARAFAAAGAKIYAPKGSSGFLQTALNRKEMPADRLSASGRKAEVTPVEGRFTMTDAARPVEAVSLGPNPHVDSMLGVFLPKQKIFFVSDIHVPGSDAPAPEANRAVSECFFASWAVENLPVGTRIFNSHSSQVTTVELMKKWTESERCSEQRAVSSER
ncbi:MAG: MBL fold metallo-hydrolase [Aridibacter famidurans]|nr:MBL fold metallo-hydrolase [Aridibacter famidurans]